MAKPRDEKWLPADDSSDISFEFLRFEQAKEGHIVYVIQVTRGTLGETFEVARRYNEFAQLAQDVSNLCGLTLPLPPKKMFGNTDKAFLQKRMQGLKHMLDTLANSPILRLSLPFRRFLDPSRYGAAFQRSAEKGLFMFLRSEASWKVLEQLYGIGWRVQKTFALVLNEGYTAQNHSAPQLLSWVPVPSTCLVSPDLLGSVLKYIAGISHPFITGASLGCVHGSEDPAAITVRTFSNRGSLRDLVHRAKNPKLAFARKYVTKKPRGLDIRLVRLFGRQILEALKFLNERGLPYGHLHAGNVVVVNDRLCQITDIENGVLGLTSLYQSYVTELKKVSTLELMDVYCFGHVLYEMVMGQPLGAPTCEYIHHSTPAGDILSQLVTPDGVRSLPTIAQLLQEPFFRDVDLGQVERGSFKLSARAKEAIHTAKTESYKAMRKRQAAFDRLRKKHEKEREERKRQQQRERERSRQVKTKQSTSATELNATTGGIVAPSTRPTATATASSQPDGAAQTSSSSSSSGAQQQQGQPQPAASASSSSPPPPAPAAPAPSAPEKQEQRQPPPASSSGRGALLSSIQGFSKGGLKKATTNDRSAPKV